MHVRACTSCPITVDMRGQALMRCRHDVLCAHWLLFVKSHAFSLDETQNSLFLVNMNEGEMIQHFEGSTWGDACLRAHHILFHILLNGLPYSNIMFL